MNEDLKHYGIPGMKWGVRRRTGSDGKVVKSKSRIRKEIESVSREVKSVGALRKPERFTNEQLKNKTQRLQNENSLKRLTKGKKRKEYLDRSKLSDSDLKSRVERLQLEDNLKKQVKSANGNQIKAANKLISEGSKTALSKFTDSSGEFSPTGRPEVDIVLRETLKYAKSNKVIK